jgi:hypothetical protein
MSPEPDQARQYDPRVRAELKTRSLGRQVTPGAISSDLCRRTEGTDWNDVATKLSRYATWEFEDYSEAK